MTTEFKLNRQEVEKAIKEQMAYFTNIAPVLKANPRYQDPECLTVGPLRQKQTPPQPAKAVRAQLKLKKSSGTIRHRRAFA